MTKANIETILCAVTGNEDATKRSGWYLQQFMKMGYSSIAESGFSEYETYGNMLAYIIKRVIA